MNEYGNIPEKILEIELSEEFNVTSWTSYRRTVREIIDSNGEEIEDCSYEMYSTEEYGYPRLSKFTAWTNNKVLFLINDGTGQDFILSIPRHP